MDFEADDLLEEGFFFLDETDALDEESDGYDSGDEEVGEGELRALGRTRGSGGKAKAKPKRKQHYTGNSDRTKRHAARFISAYGLGLTGPEAAWANRRYHGHRTLPPDMASKLKTEHEKKYGTSTNNI